MSDNKLVIFSLDGVCWEFVQPWMDEGRLPTLERITESGVKSRLESCQPATTPPAWTSLTTGMNPGKHGIFSFYRRNPGTYDVDPVSDADVHARRFWEYTSEANLTSLVLNVPVTHPARPIDGVLIPGYMAPDTPTPFPEDALEDFKQEYTVYAESESKDVPERQLCDEWIELTKSRRDLSLHLMNKYDWDVLFLEFQKTDGAVHKLSDRELIAEIYECVDDCMQDVLEATDCEPNTFVVSDHGIGQQKDWEVALNTWLVDEGYAHTTVSETEEQSWRDAVDDTETTDQETSAMLSLLSRLGFTQQRAERALARIGLYETVAKYTPSGMGSTLGKEVIDYAKSDAFYQGFGFSGVDTGIILNDERFYDEGTVSEAEYEALRQELMESLRNLKGPDGSAPFEDVRRRGDVYDGEYTSLAPDIILTQSDDYVIGSKQPRGKTFISSPENRIDHKRHGLLVATGPDIQNEAELDTIPSIMDITPTLLHLLDIPLNERFDGDTLSEVLSVEHRPSWKSYKQKHITQDHSITTEDEDELSERLKSMGYLE